MAGTDRAIKKQEPSQFVLFTTYDDDQLKVDRMGKICITHGRDETYIQSST